MNWSKYLKYLGVTLMLLLVFGSGWWVRDHGAQQELQDLLAGHQIQLQEIEVTRVEQVTSLTKALADEEANRDVLLDQLASIKSKPAEVKYIVRTETVIQGGPSRVVTTLPDSHRFQMENGLVVANFQVDEGPTYTFETADLILSADVLIADRDSAISIRAQSSLDPDVEVEIPIEEFNVEHIREQRVFEPHILLGGAGGASTSEGNGPAGLIGPAAGVSLLHFRRVDAAAPFAVATPGSPSGATIGFSPVLYNLADPLPVVTNLWIGAGPTVNLRGQLGASVYLGAKL